MPVILPGRNKDNNPHLEKSTDQHKRRRVVKRKASPLQQHSTVGSRQKRGRPLEDLGNAIVSLFPVEVQYNIRGTCRNARRAVCGLVQAVCAPIQKLLTDETKS